MPLLKVNHRKHYLTALWFDWCTGKPSIKEKKCGNFAKGMKGEFKAVWGFWTDGFRILQFLWGYSDIDFL